MENPPRKNILPGDCQSITEAITMVDPSKVYIFEEPLPSNLQGYQSTIYLAKDRTLNQLPVIIKKLKNNAQYWVTVHEEKLQIPKEISISWQAQRVPGVIRILDIISHENNFYLVLEKLFNAVDLQTWFSQQKYYISEALIRRIVTHVIYIVLNLELIGIYHGDIKAENILYAPETGEVKLIDFGHGRLKAEIKPLCYAGTPSYHPPEWKKKCLYFEPAITTYSIGVLTYFLLVGYLPHSYPKKPLEFPEVISLPARKFICACMNINWSQRPKLQELLGDEWILG